MADTNWTILPEFDEGHQNRYIVMVSDRPVADDVAKKFPKICSKPFELKNDKYLWGLYVDNSTRDERRNIYKFFLGETDSVHELKKEEEIKSVISDLNNIFSTLTKSEQRHIEEEIPGKIESIEEIAEKKSEEKNAAVARTDVPILATETKTEISPLSISVETKQEPPKDLKIEIERFGESASSSVSPYPEKEASDGVLPVGKETTVSSQPAPLVPIAAPGLSPQELPAAASPGESIKVGYLYPLSSPETLEKFISQLRTITEKTMKIPIYLEKVSETGYNTTVSNDFNSIISAAKLKKADIILAVIPDGIDDIRLFIDTACRRNEILYMVAQQSQLDKKFLFVDMAIELLLIKKKLR
ncbi:MAG: hypothetical protein COS68_02715 [Elusimicrobia bacterium CG06_land_8_20_14_3_00_38_11]|nr:MAG: hypothetical protein COS68_02715 [Elusimicrobia bacterium CG06_land_8_20_14_3_00_38_11]